MIITKKSPFAPHDASRDGRGRRIAIARCNVPGHGGRSRSRPTPRRGLSPEWRHLRSVAAYGCLEPTMSSRRHWRC